MDDVRTFAVMEFSPFNPVVKLCIEGMTLEEKGERLEAGKVFGQAWEQATDDFERFLAAYYIARVQENVPERLTWLETSLACAEKTGDDTAMSAYPALYAAMAQCHAFLGDDEKSQAYADKGEAYKQNPAARGPFYHGTKAQLAIGDLLTPGGNSNYQSDLQMNHIYFTALVNGAGLAAALAKGNDPERVYIVEPTGAYENDPNLTDKKFPGNPTRSYRSAEPLKITGEVTDWEKPAPEAVRKFREKVDNSNGEIIN